MSRLMERFTIWHSKRFTGYALKIVKRISVLFFPSLLPFVLAIAACHPSNATDAEAKGDVEWLEADGSADAVAALGRLADKHRKALSALETRSTFDPNAYVAAWAAHLRGATWSIPFLR